MFSSKDHYVKNRYRKILLIQLWGIGETVLTMPAIRALKNKYSNSRITLLATARNADVYKGFSDIDQIKILKMCPLRIISFMISRFRRYDLVVDFEEYLNISSIITFFVGKDRIGFDHGARRSVYTKTRHYNDVQHTSQTFMDLVRVLGCELRYEKLIRLKTTDKEKRAVADFFKKNSITKKNLVVGITPGAAESAKFRMWPQERYSKLIDKIVERYKRKKPVILLIGAEFDKKIINKVIGSVENKRRVIDCSGKFSLRQTFYLIERCDLYISNDTGPMHVAAAQDVKTIGLFGPNTPTRWAPYGKGNISVYKNFYCSPCINSHLGQFGPCKCDTEGQCMRKIAVADVFKAVERIL